eukprot:1233294-Alexandrium_andersonii.AAC.1
MVFRGHGHDKALPAEQSDQSSEVQEHIKHGWCLSLHVGYPTVFENSIQSPFMCMSAAVKVRSVCPAAARARCWSLECQSAPSCLQVAMVPRAIRLNDHCSHANTVRIEHQPRQPQWQSRDFFKATQTCRAPLT